MVATALQRDIVEETYRDVDEKIEKIVWRFIHRHGGNFDELKAEANYAFVRGMYEFPHNKKRSTFNTWLYHIVSTALGDNLRLNYRPPALPIEDFKNSAKAQTSFSPAELLDEISNDACTIISLFLDTPAEIYKDALLNGKHHRHLKASLKRHLIQLGWTMKRISDSFEEIRYALTY